MPEESAVLRFQSTAMENSIRNIVPFCRAAIFTLEMLCFWSLSSSKHTPARGLPLLARKTLGNMAMV